MARIRVKKMHVVADSFFTLSAGCLSSKPPHWSRFSSFSSWAWRCVCVWCVCGGGTHKCECEHAWIGH